MENEEIMGWLGQRLVYHGRAIVNVNLCGVKPPRQVLIEALDKARQAERELIFSKLKSDIDKIKFFAGDDAQTVWEHLKTALKKTRELKPKGGGS